METLDNFITQKPIRLLSSEALFDVLYYIYFVVALLKVFQVVPVFIALITAVDHCSTRGSDMISLPTQAQRGVALIMSSKLAPARSVVVTFGGE